MRLRRLLLSAFAVLPAAFAPLAAAAHPHMFADARLDVTLTPDNQTIGSLRHIWRFDEVSSSMMMVDLDANGDMTLDDSELDAAGRIMLKSMAEYNFFQIVTQDGKDVPMAPPPRIVTSWENNQLFTMLETQPMTALKLSGKIALGIYDPTFYVAIDFVEDNKMVVAKLPPQCSREVVRPDPDEAIAQNQSTIDNAFRNDPSGNDMSKIFATRLELSCPPAED